MYGFYLALIIYFGIGLLIYMGISMGLFSLDINSKKTGEYVDKNTREYEILKLVFSIGWIVMAIQVIGRCYCNNEQNNRY